MLSELSKKIEYEKDKLEKIHESDLKGRERQHQINIDNQRKIFEQQNESIRR
jgi:hypothetical protein